MAESKTTTTNRPDTSRESGQSMERRDREQTPGPRRQNAGWLASPFSMMDRMVEEMDRMFRDFGMPRRSWPARSPFGPSERAGIWSPRVEAIQKGDRFIVRAELPGMKKDDIQVDLTDDAITIRGERREERQDEREGYYHTEREYGEFYRTIPVPEGVIAESAQASFKDGVLEISMQAPPEAARRRRLEIKESAEGGERK
jgi:HSP20 family protein